jgi:branched-chain amino acid transport system ATP-binding protein
MQPDETLLRLEAVQKRFGGLVVLNNIDIAVGPNELIGLIGPNGAGKSTLFNLITAIYTPTQGRIRFRGRDITGTAPHRICRLGIARTFQLVRTFLTMTAFENIMVGAVYGAGGRVKHATVATQEALELVGLTAKRDVRTAHMTLSDRRLLEIARAVASSPALLLLDEPMAGLNPTEIQRMVDVIRRVRNERGVSILWVEHKVDAIMKVCSRVIVLDHGEKIADGTPREIVANRRVIEAYLGEPAA